MKIVHLTDIHVQAAPHLRELTGKRLLGTANLYVLGRRSKFSVTSDPSNPTASLNDAVITLVDATMPAHGGHGMTVTPDVTDNGDGTAVAGPIKLHMPGYWVLRVDLEVNGAEDAAEFDIECCD